MTTEITTDDITTGVLRLDGLTMEAGVNTRTEVVVATYHKMFK